MSVFDLPHELDSPHENTYNLDTVDHIVASAVSAAIAQYEVRRANLESSISLRLSLNKKEEGIMSSKYRERVKVGLDENGKPIYQWVSAETKDGLHNAICNVLSVGTVADHAADPPAHTDGHISNNDSHGILWQDIADEWFNTFHIQRVRKKTLAKDRSLFDRHVRPAFADVPVETITTTDVQVMLETKASYCKSQVRDIMSMLKQIFALAVDKDLIRKSPMDSSLIYNPSRKPDRPRGAIPQAAQSDIIAHLDDLREVYDRNGNNTNALRFMAFLMFTGLRPCEIYGLRWEDIDIGRLELTISRDLVFISGEGILGEPKTEESQRTIPFDPVLLRYLSPVQTSGFIIHMSGEGREDEHFTEQAANNMWRRIKKHIDVHGMTPYMARHTFATNMNKAGVPIKTAMSMMGHKDERMLLRRYTHTDNEDLTKAAQSVSAYISTISTNK